MSQVAVLCCRADVDAVGAVPGWAPVLRALSTASISWVGARPGKEIDDLLTDRVVVVGDDADLAAVVLRLHRKDRLTDVAVGYVATSPTPVTAVHSLPTGSKAVSLALTGDPDPVPLIRDDVGGVLVGRAVLAPVNGTVYVDEHRLLRGSAKAVQVVPDPTLGLDVSVVRPGWMMFRNRVQRRAGRAVQIGTSPAQVTSDGVLYPRTMTRWTFYKHTEPLRLVRGLV